MGRRADDTTGKAARKGKGPVISFDEGARKQFLTGFRKRKNERRQHARQKIAEQVRNEKIEARNQLENYVYSMKNQLSDSEKGVADKIGDDDKETIEKALEEVNEWLDDNQDAEKDDFEEKLKEVQDTCSPIISKVYKESGGAPGGGGFGGGDDDDLDGHDEL